MVTLVRARAVLIAGLLVMATAGCGPSPSGTSGAGPTNAPTNAPATGPTETASGPGATAGGTSGATVTDACDLLTDAEIEAGTGYAVASEDPDPPDTVYPSACVWKFEGANWELNVGVLPTGGGEFLDKVVQIEGGTPIEGLGDRAVETDVSGTILVVVGDMLLDLQFVAFGEPDDAAQRLAAIAVARLGR